MGQELVPRFCFSPKERGVLFGNGIESGTLDGEQQNIEARLLAQLDERDRRNEDDKRDGKANEN